MLPIAGKIVLLVFIVATAYAFVTRVKFLVSLLKLGKPEKRFDKPISRFMYVLGQVLLQRCVLKNVTGKDRSGLGHVLIFYGFCLFVISYGFHISEGFFEALSPALFGAYANNAFFLLLDIAGLVVILALIWAALRRYLSRPSRLEPIMSKGAAIVLVWIFLLMIFGFSVEGFRLLAEEKPFAEWAFMGMAFSGIFSSFGLESQAKIFFYLVWFLHMALIFAFGIYILYSKHLPTHIRSHLARSSVSKKAASVNPSATPAERSTSFPTLQAVRENVLAEAESQYLKDLLAHTGGDIKGACRLSGLSRSRLYSLLKKYGLSSGV